MKKINSKYVTIFGGLFFSIIVGMTLQSVLAFSYFKSSTLALLSWILFNQLVEKQGEEE